MEVSHPPLCTSFLDYFAEWTAFSKIVIAYEPVWAIGTGKVATSTQVAKFMFIMYLSILTSHSAGFIIGTRGSS